MIKVITLSILGCWLAGGFGLLVGIGAGLVLDDLARASGVSS
jgi:hypothetical protein